MFWLLEDLLYKDIPLTLYVKIDNIIDTPPSSLMDSIASPKVKTTKREGVGACSLAHNTSGVEGHAGAPQWD
jgi:hypothetical protein